MRSVLDQEGAVESRGLMLSGREEIWQKLITGSKHWSTIKAENTWFRTPPSPDTPPRLQSGQHILPCCGQDEHWKWRSYVDLMLGQRLRRWSNIKST